MKNIEVYENENGEVAVLVSMGYGAGWSTWNWYQELAYDKRVIEFYLENKDNLDNINADFIIDTIENFGYNNVYAGGFHQCKIVYIPHGKMFRIKEHDGAEYIEYLNPNDYISF